MYFSKPIVEDKENQGIKKSRLFNGLDEIAIDGFLSLITGNNPYHPASQLSSNELINNFRYDVLCLIGSRGVIARESFSENGNCFYSEVYCPFEFFVPNQFMRPLVDAIVYYLPFSLLDSLEFSGKIWKNLFLDSEMRNSYQQNQRDDLFSKEVDHRILGYYKNCAEMAGQLSDGKYVITLPNALLSQGTIGKTIYTTRETVSRVNKGLKDKGSEFSRHNGNTTVKIPSDLFS